MLNVHAKSKNRVITSTTLLSLAVIALVSGVYLLTLTLSPMVIPMVAHKEIKLADLPTPTKSENRVIIPKIGVDIKYAPGDDALDKGAQWRFPQRGNPKSGGNFIIAAHRLSIQPTPQATVEKSPFYNIDKLAIGDDIVIDYLGKRYTYTINKIFNVKPDQVEIEAPSDTPKLTLYSCDLTGAATGRVVIIGEPSNPNSFKDLSVAQTAHRDQ